MISQVLRNSNPEFIGKLFNLVDKSGDGTVDFSGLLLMVMMMMAMVLLRTMMVILDFSRLLLLVVMLAMLANLELAMVVVLAVSFMFCFSLLHGQVNLCSFFIPLFFSPQNS